MFCFKMQYGNMSRKSNTNELFCVFLRAIRSYFDVIAQPMEVWCAYDIIIAIQY